MTKISQDINYHKDLFPKEFRKSMLDNELEIRERVKCGNYFWGFCKLKEADKNNNPNWCDREKCRKWKLR